MLILPFSLGPERYAIPAQEIVEIVPAVSLRPVPQAPPFLAGIFFRRTDVVPVIDLRLMVRQEPSLRRLSTRIMITHCPAEQTPGPLLGLLVERLTDAVSVPESALQGSTLALRDAPYLGDIIAGKEAMIQMIRLDRLLPKTVRDEIFHAHR